MKLETQIRKINERIAKIPTVLPEHSDAGHFYRVFPDNAESELYESVTKKIGFVKDEGLMNWRRDKSVGYIANKIQFDAARDPKYWLEIQDIATLVEEAKKVPEDIFHEAGDIGTIIHGYREQYFKLFIKTGQWPANFVVDNKDPRVISGFRGVQRFVQKSGYIPVSTELIVFDRKMGLAGQLDDLGLIPVGHNKYELVLMDLKTSNYHKDSYHLQVGLYYYMLKKLTGLAPKATFILKVSKLDGTYDLEYIKNVPRAVQVAKRAVALYDDLQYIKDSRKREVINI